MIFTTRYGKTGRGNIESARVGNITALAVLSGPRPADYRLLESMGKN